MSELENKLDNLLAEDLGVAPAQVTGSLIRDLRDKQLPGEIAYEMESTYGGYITEHSHVMTCAEIAIVEEKADAFLDRFSTKHAL